MLFCFSQGKTRRWQLHYYYRTNSPLQDNDGKHSAWISSMGCNIDVNYGCCHLYSCCNVHHMEMVSTM